ncbi:MAG TPA: MerR family transcriptional regulator [Acidimicrobiia bacterium]|nr:MerR family transcriptional regulator [Acidimicrobiia bacterium]
MVEEPLSIGDVINLLRDDFPDVSVSKIRFLEAQGLISPARSTAGYRQFGPTEIRRLQYILGLQRDHFLPLKVIKSKLTLWERGEDQGSGPGDPPAIDPEREPLTRNDLVRRSGLSSLELEALIAHGLITSVADTSGELYPGWTLPAGIEARQLLELGFEPRHLRQVRLAVEREADMLSQLLGAPLGSAQNEVRSRAQQSLEDGTEAVASLHRILLGARLGEMLSE